MRRIVLVPIPEGGCPTGRLVKIQDQISEGDHIFFTDMCWNYCFQTSDDGCNSDGVMHFSEGKDDEGKKIPETTIVFGGINYILYTPVHEIRKVEAEDISFERKPGASGGTFFLFFYDTETVMITREWEGYVIQII